MSILKKPAVVTDSIMDYIEKLYAEGTDMDKIAPYIEQKFRISIKDSAKILWYWKNIRGKDLKS